VAVDENAGSSLPYSSTEQSV
ncbi:hypothetical protein, partial [Mycobacterium tuberculosis]